MIFKWEKSDDQIKYNQNQNQNSKDLKQAVKTLIGCFMIIMMNLCYANKSKMSKIESSF